MLNDRNRILILSALLALTAGIAQASEHLAGGTMLRTRYADVAVDPDGTPFVAYAGDGAVNLLWRDGGAWTSATRVTGSIEPYCAMVRDGFGATHFATQAIATNGVDRYLLYLIFENGFWTLRTPDLPDAALGDTLTGTRPDIAVDGDGNPYISYLWSDGEGVSLGDLRVAYSIGGVWTVETVDGGPDDVGDWSSIVIDAAGRPRVAYYDRGNGNLMSARKSATGNWILEVIDAGVDVGAWTDIALDAAGVPYVSYVDRIDGSVRCADRNGGAWQSEAVPDISTPDPEGTSIAVDSQGDIHITYMNTTASKLRHVVRSGGVWSSEVLDETAGLGNRPVLALDADDLPHVVHLEEPGQDVWYVEGTAATGAGDAPRAVALQLRAYPNPAGAGSPVGLALAGDKSEFAGAAVFEIYDAAGRLVRRIASLTGRAQWDGRDAAGRPAPAGVYPVRCRGGGVSAQGRIVLVQ